jgi:hypothetical protein
VRTKDARLRSHLDAWRRCGQRSTADAGARQLLGAAVKADVVAETLFELERVVRLHFAGEPEKAAALNVVALVDGLKALTSQLELLWSSLPLGKDPQEMVDAVAALGPMSEYGKAFLDEAWSGQRAHVRELYLASDPNMETFSKVGDE